MSRWRVFVALRLAESGATTEVVELPPPPPPLSSVQLPPIIRRAPHIAMSPTRRQRPPRAPSSTASTPRRSGISRRSLTAYRYAASRLLSRVLRQWRAFTEFQASSRASASADAAARKHRRSVVLRVCFARLHSNALLERHIQQCERKARRNNYFRLHRLVFCAWAQVLATKKERVHHFIHIRRPALKLLQCFKQWELHTQPRVCAARARRASAQNSLRLRQRGLRALRAFASARAIQKARLVVAIRHRREYICHQTLEALRVVVLRAKAARAAATDMQRKRVMLCVRDTFEKWDMWTTNTIKAQEADAMAQNYYNRRILLTYVCWWADWTEERVSRRHQLETARTHWESVTIAKTFDAWARLWQLAGNARAMKSNVARAHWRVKVLRRHFIGWNQCKILGPIEAHARAAANSPRRQIC